LPIVPRSGRRILNHPEPAFPGLSPLNHEMQDSTDLENLEANVAECGFGGVRAGPALKHLLLVTDGTMAHDRAYAC